MEALFAPDWRDGVPYQRLLAEALTDLGVGVRFLQGYRRVLPLTRLVQAERGADLLHLHWPEAYYPATGKWGDRWRAARFPLDLHLATRSCPLVVTAHNLLAHNRAGAPFALRNAVAPLRRARAVIAHSEVARQAVVDLAGIASAKVHVIPHGDLSAPLAPLLPRDEARAALGWDAEPRVLMFGTVEPYKGIEEVLAWWRSERPPARLVVAGRPCTEAYGAAIAEAALGTELHLSWLDDPTLRRYLSACDAVLFNYRVIFTSGAASLARSLGVPLLLPARLRTVDLGEPDARVFRFASFETDFAARLDEALKVGSDYEAAAAWRAEIAWPKIAAQHARVYRTVV